MPDQNSVAQRLATLSTEKRQALEKLLRDKFARNTELRRRTAGEPVPLTYGQRRLWLLDQITPGNPAYNETNSLRFRFPLDVDVLRRAVDEIVRRHESLRMRAYVADGQPFQDFAPSLTLNIPLIDLRQMPPVEREPEALRHAAEQSNVPFDLGEPPLLRASLYRLDTNDFLFALTMHHMICDGWSMGVFMVEILALYWSLVAGKPSPLPEPEIQYGDYAVWQHRVLSGAAQTGQLSYWRQQLKDVPTLDLPADRPRPAEFTFRGARHQLEIAGPAYAALTSLAERRNVTLFMVLLAVFAVLLHRYTEQEDIPIGTPSAGRSRKELEPLIGFFINNLVLRLKLRAGETFLDVLDNVRATVVEAFANQDVPFERLVEELQPKRDKSRNPLFQVTFQLFQGPAKGLRKELLLPFTPVESGIAKFDLSVELIWTDDAMRGHIEYNTDLFDASRIERMAEHFHRLIHSATTNPAERVSGLALLTPDEERKLIYEWNRTSVPYPRDRTIPEVFFEQTEQTPDAAAVCFGGHTLTYKELRESSAAVAVELASRGIARGDFVGLYLARCLEAPAALLGILQVGAAYVPLDPGYPRERLSFLIADSGVRAILTDSARSGDLQDFDGAVIVIDAPSATRSGFTAPDAAGSAADIAYVMYTSGTTGQPKGVPVTHRNILRLVKNVSYVDVASPHTMLQFAPISFDASTFEIWGSLLNGGKLAVYPGGLPSLEELGAFIRSEQISILFLTTSLFRQMIEHCPGDLRGVGQIITGGEEMWVPVAKAAWTALPRSRIMNAYGPTECTTFATIYPIGSPETLRENVPIGRPIENTTAYVLDRHGNLMPVGVPGELHIGGDGVAPGYWRPDELTAERFISDPIRAGGRLYRTGDVAAWREDGNLLFLGRRDRQVKVSGYRIELGEVEAAIRSHPDVQAVAVVVTGAEDKRLSAFCQPCAASSLSSAELGSYLSQRLPKYMLPSRLEIIERLPITKNGKIDLEALSRRESTINPRQDGFIAPRDATEAALAEIWSELLQAGRVGVTDNFFELGGQSLVATRLLSRIRTAFETQITMREFFDNPTIAELASLLSNKTTGHPVAVSGGRE